MRKVIVSMPPGPAGKAEQMREAVAKHLGVPPADVLVVSEATVTVVDVPSEPKVYQPDGKPDVTEVSLEVFKQTPPLPTGGGSTAPPRGKRNGKDKDE